MLDKLFIVLVLYKASLEDSSTVSSLSKTLVSSVDLLVYDNSPDKQYSEEYFQYGKFNVRYYHDYRNLGISTAYNYALKLAGIEKKNWLLLLDQDTTMTLPFVKELSKLKIENFSDNVVAIIPKVISSDQNQIISPTKMSIGGVCRPLELADGIVEKPISGINSGSILKVSYLNSISGFSDKFPLDMLDHWYFRQISNDKRDIYLLKSQIYQDLSVLGDFDHNVSFARYQKLLDAEYLFIEREGFLGKFVFKLRLIFRVVKQVKYKNNQYYKYTFKKIFKATS